jgi:hypothetical protein
MGGDEDKVKSLDTASVVDRDPQALRSCWIELEVGRTRRSWLPYSANSESDVHTAGIVLHNVKRESVSNPVAYINYIHIVLH